jgi:putative restriction endonuclease
MSEPDFDRPPAVLPIDRETLLARFDGIRQFAQGGRRAPHKPLLLLYALARLKHDRVASVGFNAAEAVVAPLLRSYGPWHSGAHVSYPYGRLVNDGIWRLADRTELLDAKGNVREVLARQRDARAGFTPEVLAAFAYAPELIDVVALRLLERHFAISLHEEILRAVGLELGTPPPVTLRRGATFRADVLTAYLAECCVCGFSLRLFEGLIGVDAAHIRWHAHGGPDEVPNGLALCALHHRLFDHGAITVCEDLRVRVSRTIAGNSARALLERLEGQPLRLPVDREFHPNPKHLHWHHAQVFQGQI